VGLTTQPPSFADYLEIWEPQPPGNQQFHKISSFIDLFIVHDPSEGSQEPSVGRQIRFDISYPKTHRHKHTGRNDFINLLFSLLRKEICQSSSFVRIIFPCKQHLSGMMNASTYSGFLIS